MTDLRNLPVGTKIKLPCGCVWKRVEQPDYYSTPGIPCFRMSKPCSRNHLKEWGDYQSTRWIYEVEGAEIL